MWPNVLNDAASLGIAGLLFVMWWHERQERIRNSLLQRDAQSVADVVNAAHGKLLDVVRANTEAVVSLREEMKSQRATAGEWLARISNQLDEIEHQGAE